MTTVQMGELSRANRRAPGDAHLLSSRKRRAMTERPFHRKTYGCVVSEIAHSTHNRENAATRRSSWRQRGGRAIESVCVTPTHLSFLCFGLTWIINLKFEGLRAPHSF